MSLNEPSNENYGIVSRFWKKYRISVELDNNGMQNFLYFFRHIDHPVYSEKHGGVHFIDYYYYF